MTQEYYKNSIGKEKAASTVGSSESGRREQVLTSLVSATSVQETGWNVKGSGPANTGGLGPLQVRRLADRLTPRQRRDVVRLALAILAAEA